MKRNKPLKRKTPLRANPETTRKWKERSRKTLPKRTPKRRAQETTYRNLYPKFLEEHPICPVTGERTNQIHHSAQRFGQWLNLVRYWIALSPRGHDWVGRHAEQAEKLGLIVRINQTYEDHIRFLLDSYINLNEPLFYKQQHFHEAELILLRKQLSIAGPA